MNTFNEFEQRSKSMSMTSSHQENIPPVPVHPRSMTINVESMIIINIHFFKFTKNRLSSDYYFSTRQIHFSLQFEQY